MDADAIGGSVNLVTKVPEGRRAATSRRTWAAVLLARANDTGSRLEAAGRRPRVGFLLAGSCDRNNRAIDDVERVGRWTAPGRSYPVEWDQRDYSYGRTRYGAGGDPRLPIQRNGGHGIPQGHVEPVRQRRDSVPV